MGFLSGGERGRPRWWGAARKRSRILPAAGRPARTRPPVVRRRRSRVEQSEPGGGREPAGPPRRTVGRAPGRAERVVPGTGHTGASHPGSGARRWTPVGADAEQAPLRRTGLAASRGGASPERPRVALRRPPGPAGDAPVGAPAIGADLSARSRRSSPPPPIPQPAGLAPEGDAVPVGRAPARRPPPERSGLGAEPGTGTPAPVPLRRGRSAEERGPRQASLVETPAPAGAAPRPAGGPGRRRPGRARSRARSRHSSPAPPPGARSSHERSKTTPPPPVEGKTTRRPIFRTDEGAGCPAPKTETPATLPERRGARCAARHGTRTGLATRRLKKPAPRPVTSATTGGNSPSGLPSRLRSYKRKTGAPRPKAGRTGRVG